MNNKAGIIIIKVLTTSSPLPPSLMSTLISANASSHFRNISEICKLNIRNTRTLWRRGRRGGALIVVVLVALVTAAAAFSVVARGV